MEGTMLVRIVMLAARSWLLRAYKRRRRLPEPRFYCAPADQAMDILKWHVRDQLTMGLQATFPCKSGKP
jgi:hypothetical protein